MPAMKIRVGDEGLPLDRVPVMLTDPIRRRRETLRLAVAAGIGGAVVLLGTLAEALIG